MKGLLETRPVRAGILPHDVDLIGVYGKINGKIQLLATVGTMNHCGAVETANLFVASPLLYEALEQQFAQWQLISNMVEDDEAIAATIEASMTLINNALRAARGEK